MTHAFVPPAQQSRLESGTAATWHTGGATALVVVRGRAWVTFAAGACEDAPRGGDWFVAAGEALQVPKGCTAVVQADGAPGEALVFGWLVAARPPRAGWQSSIAQPWADLGASARLAVRACGQLVAGLVRWSQPAWACKDRPRQTA